LLGHTTPTKENLSKIKNLKVLRRLMPVSPNVAPAARTKLSEQSLTPLRSHFSLENWSKEFSKFCVEIVGVSEEVDGGQKI